MMRMRFGLKALVCSLPFCLAMLTAAAQPETLTVDENCQVEVPDYTDGVVFCQAIGCPDGTNLEQIFPPPGLFTPGDVTADDWPEDVPDAFPDWPSEDMGVYVRNTIDDVETISKVAVIKDVTAPYIKEGAPVTSILYRRVVFSGSAVVIPDFIADIRPFILDNCSEFADITFLQSPDVGSVIPISTLPAGRLVTVSARDERGNTRNITARVEVVDAADTRPVITPNEVKPTDRLFADICPGGWDCGTLAYWEHFWECGVPFDDPGATAFDPSTGNDVSHLIQSRIVDGVVPDHSTSTATFPDFPGPAFTVQYWTLPDESDLVERRVFVWDISDPVITLGAIGGGPSGAQDLWRDWPASAQPGWEEPEWVQDLREANASETDPGFWVNNLPLFNFVNQPWNDDTAMPWRCWQFDPYEEFLDVYDDCEGRFDQAKLDSNVLVVIVKIRYASALYTDGEETYYAGGWLGDIRASGLDLPWGRPSTGNLNPWYGFRVYYIAWDDAGNYNFVSRHINPVSGEGIALAEPTTITIRCDGNGLEQLSEVERRDTAWSWCRGEVTHLIRGTGGIDQTPEGYYVPGTYFREYTIEGGQIWPYPWTRTIIVEDTPPDVLIYDEQGNEVADEIVCGCVSRENIIVVPWCEFLAFGTAGDSLQDRADAWLEGWWAVQPGYDLSDIGNYGYSATHICQDDTMMTAWVDVRGMGVVTNAMINIAQTGNMYALGKYPINYTLNYPDHDIAAARRSVLLTDDISLDLVFSPLGTEVREESDRTVVTMQCGAGYPFVLPEIGRIWDNCTGTAITRDIIIDAYEVVGTELEEVDPNLISTARAGVYLIYYGALYSGSPIPAPVRTVEVRVEDGTPPVITLLGDETLELECNTPFTDPGAVALDACEGNLTAFIVVSGYPATPAVGSVGYRTYTVTDSSGNSASVTRTILVPGISMTLNDVDRVESHPTYGRVYVTEWECNKPYVDPGVASAVDDCTGITFPVSLIQVAGVPSVTPPNGSEFYVTYSLSYGGNTTVVRRLVRVMNADGPVIELEGEGQAPVDMLQETDPEPEWWEHALAAYEAKYPESSGNPQLPGDWLVAEGWDTSLGDPLPWNCDLDAYEDPGASAQDICDGSVITDDMVLILTRYNVEEGVEYFRYVGRFGDFAADPPGEAYGDDGAALPDGTPRNLLVDQSGAVWAGYRAYFIAWDTAGNFSVVSRLIEPAYLELNVSPSEMTVECGGELPVATIIAADLCYSTALTPVRWIWHNDPDTGLEMDGAVPANYTEEEALSQPGSYVIVYAATDEYDNSIPELDGSGQPVDPEALVEAGGPYLQLLTVRDTVKPVITLTGGATVQLAYGETWTEPGYTALDACDGDLTAAVTRSGIVNPVLLGPQPLVYSVTDGAGNRAEVTRTVYVLDLSELEIIVDPPVISIECGTVYVDAGVTARDNRDGADLTGSIRVNGLISALVGSGGARPGTYTITYTVQRVPDGNEASATRSVIVADSEPPVLTLRGAAELTVDCGAAYRDAGVMSAMDDCDGDVFRRVVQTGNVDTNVPGLHVITFSARDAAGNTGIATRSVTVRDNCKSDEGEGEVPVEGEFEGEPLGPVQVPDVTLQTPEAAQDLLADVGLVVGEVTCVCNDTVPQGSIISQDPAPGTVVDPQTPVNLVVSDGPCISCGCDGLDGVNWANLFLGILALVVLLIVSFTVGGEVIKF